MSVARHLAINIDEYDARIRTFIAFYEEMLGVAAAAAATVRPRVVVDLGIGTGALASRLSRKHVRIVGIDEDESMLAAARTRLIRRRAAFVSGSFLDTAIPRCDAVMSSLALHHVASAAAKVRLFRKVRAALRNDGILVSADCHPSALPAHAAAGREAWLAHLARTYGRHDAQRYLRTWAREDFYTTLEEELRLLSKAGFTCDVLWRRGSFAVIAAMPKL